MKPVIVTLTGPCCSGKSTLEKALASRGFSPAVSITTRKPRHGEIDGKAYHFVTVSQFEQLQRDGQLIESVCFGGNHYGITVAEIERLSAAGHPVTVVCEPHGQAQIAQYAKDNLWKCVSLFINAPTNLLTYRFLERFLIDSEKLDRNATIVSYAQRLSVLVEQESKWSERLGDYDFVVEEFGAETQERVLENVGTILQTLYK